MPEQRRSIQDIIPPARSHPVRPHVVQDEEAHQPPPTPPQPIRLKPEGSGFVTFALIAAGILVAAGIAIGVMSTVFHEAYVSVTPQRFSAVVDETLSAAPADPTLPYQKVEVTDTATKTVAATGSQHVENHASGTITVYNAYTTTAQRLITNTRFQTSDGLVFRIHTPIVIPGYTMKAGVKVPGSVDVIAYADQAGANYNVGLTDFTIPGLQGTQQYTLMTGHSKTPMTGGFIGEEAVVDPTLHSQTVDQLEADLERSLTSKVAAATVAGTIVFPDSVAFTYTENTDAANGSNAVVSVSGTADAPAFDENLLAHALGASSSISYAGALALENPADLSVHLNNADALGTDTPLSVAVSGTAQLVATFDQSELAKDLAGKDKSDIQSVLPEYPAISAIDVKVYPFWLSTLPSDPSKVKIQLVDKPPAGTP